MGRPSCGETGSPSAAFLVVTRDVSAADLRHTGSRLYKSRCAVRCSQFVKFPSTLCPQIAHGRFTSCPALGPAFSFSRSSEQAAAAAAAHRLLMHLQRPCRQHLLGICQLCLSICHLEALCL